MRHLLKKKFWTWFLGHKKLGSDSFGAASPDPMAQLTQKSDWHVLVVEDHEISRKVAGVLLQSMGHRVTFAENGVQALALARVGAFDLVLMDIHMPQMDGLTCARHIRALPEPQALVPMVALTADLNDQIVKLSKMAGMQHVLSKPLQKSLLAKLMPEKI